MPDIILGDGKYIRIENRIKGRTPTKQAVIRITDEPIVVSKQKPAPPPPPPDPPPPDPPPPSSTGLVVGYGKDATGGEGGTVYTPSTYAAYKSACERSGRRIIRPTALIDGGGASLDIENDDFTIEGAYTKRLHHRVSASNFVLRNNRFRPGDQVNSPNDADGLTITGAKKAVRVGLIDHCSLSWGSDIGGIAMLADVDYITIQYTIMGPGLAYSAHYEARPPNTHHKAANFTSQDASKWPKHITVFRSVFMGGEDRVPQIVGVDYMDAINCVAYDWKQRSGHGNPRRLNYIGNMIKVGPQTTGGKYVFQTDPNSTFPSVFPASVFLGDGSAAYPRNLAIGFAYAHQVNSSALRTTPAHPLFEVPVSAPSVALLNEVCDAAGALPRDSIDATLMGHVKAGTGSQYNGVGYPAPNPSWPTV